MRRALVVALVLLVIAWLTYRVTRNESVPHPVAAPDSAQAGLKAATLYFAAPDGSGLFEESRELLDRGTLHERVATLVSELDRGPRGGGVAALPPGTAVLRVYLDDQGLMTLDLNRAFQQGFSGGSTAEYLAIASLVRTLAANVPGVRRLQITCGGAPLSTLGGHVPLGRPLDVSDWP